MESRIESVEMVIRRSGYPDRVIRLVEGSTRIGRAEDNDIVLADVGVSRRHARLIVLPQEVRVEDLGSGNGTYYRGFRVQSQIVEDNDEIIVDPFVLKFRIRRAASEPVEVVQSVFLHVSDASGRARSFPVLAGGLTIGRSETRDVVIADPSASRHHCSVIVRDGRYILRDMGSANGVYVNSVRVRDALLNDGDRIKIGNTELRLVFGDGEVIERGDTLRGMQWNAQDPTLDQQNWPSREMPSPEVVPVTPKRKRGRGRIWFGAALGGFLSAAAVGFVVLVVVVIVVVAVLSTRVQGPTELAAAPPSWRLELPAGLPAQTVETLLVQGVDDMRSQDYRSALLDFYRVLDHEPGNPQAERLSYAAGELLVLQAIQKEISARRAVSAQKRERRDELLELAQQRSRAGRDARNELIASYREDSLVMEKLKLDPPEEQIALRAQFDAAASAKGRAAIDLSERIGLASIDSDLREAASRRAREAAREIAGEVRLTWYDGVTAERAGEFETARAAYEKVLGVDPEHPSASLRISNTTQASGGTP